MVVRFVQITKYELKLIRLNVSLERKGNPIVYVPFSRLTN